MRLSDKILILSYIKQLTVLWCTELLRKCYSLFQHLRFAWGAAAVFVDRPSPAMIWCQMKRLLQTCSGFNCQWFKRFLRISLFTTMCLSLDEAWETPRMSAGLLNLLVYSTFPKLLFHSPTFYSSSGSINEGHSRQGPFQVSFSFSHTEKKIQQQQKQ